MVYWNKNLAYNDFAQSLGMNGQDELCVDIKNKVGIK